MSAQPRHDVRTAQAIWAAERHLARLADNASRIAHALERIADHVDPPPENIERPHPEEPPPSA